MNLRIHNWFRRNPYKRTILYWKDEAESLRKEKSKLSNQLRRKQTTVDTLLRKIRRLERGRNG